MTPENKAKLLAAFDALNEIAAGGAYPPDHVRHSHGGSAFCDLCGNSLASGRPHTCPIGQAATELLVLLPDALDRDAWLADPSKPAWAGVAAREVSVPKADEGAGDGDCA